VIDVAAVVLDVDFMLENSPVFQAQVGDQLLALNASGYRVGLVSTFRDRARFDRAIGHRLEAAGVGVSLVPHTSLGVNLLRVGNAVRRLHRSRGVRCAYVRGIWGRLAIAIGAPGSIPYIYDVRGALSDETRAGGSARVKASIFRMLERESVRSARAVTAVSRPLADMLRREYNRSDVRVIPSSVSVDALAVSDEERVRARDELKIGPDETVFLYSGGLDYYQRIPDMLSLWESFLGDPKVRFLLVTNDAPNTRGATGATERFGRRLTQLSVPRARVPQVLAAGDIGFMLRESRVMNAAASPVKFAEYLAAGLAVVTSPGIGDLSELVTSERLGALVDVQRVAEGIPVVGALLREVRTGRAGFRQRALAVARERYDWRSHLAIYRTLYGAPPEVSACAAS